MPETLPPEASVSKIPGKFGSHCCNIGEFVKLFLMLSNAFSVVIST